MQKKTFCCFLYHVYIYSTQLLAHHTTRTFYVEDIIDDLVVQKLNKLKEDFYEKKNLKKNIFRSYNSFFAWPIFFFVSTDPLFHALFFFSTIYWKIRNGFPTSWLFWNFWIENWKIGHFKKKLAISLYRNFILYRNFFLKIVMIVVLLTDVHKFIFFVIRTTQKKRRMGRCVLMNFTNIL